VAELVRHDLADRACAGCDGRDGAAEGMGRDLRQLEGLALALHSAAQPASLVAPGSTEGAHHACILLGIISTCRTVGVPVQACLAWAFERLGTNRATYGLTADQLTPAAFKAAAG
jgi:hypothetical protein